MFASYKLFYNQESEVHSIKYNIETEKKQKVYMTAK